MGLPKYLPKIAQAFLRSKLVPDVLASPPLAGIMILHHMSKDAVSTSNSTRQSSSYSPLHCFSTVGLYHRRAFSSAMGCQVNYPKAEVKEGNEITPCETRDIPEVSWCTRSPGFHTLVLIDPDAPSRSKPDQKEWLHWLVGNITGTQLNTGDTMCEYVGAAPPKDTDLHRYVFLLYRHLERKPFHFPVISNTTLEGRPCFKVLVFADRYKLGDPVAGNYFLAKFDNSVPETYKQLGIK